MKTYRRILTLLAVWSAIVFVAVCAKAAETNNWWQETWNAVKPLTTATNYAFVGYGTYAPKAPNGKQWGGGVLALYNVNDYIGTGVGIDYLGQFSMISGNVELKYPIRPLAWFSPSLTNFVATPFVLGGLGTPLSGTSGATPATIIDTGAAISFGHLWGGQFNLSYAYGRWDNAGEFSGERHHLGAGWAGNSFLTWTKRF